MTIKAQVGVDQAPAPEWDARETILDALRRGMSMRDLAAVIAATLLIDDARLYGLITAAPIVDRGRCEKVLKHLAREGTVATGDEIHAKALELLAELGAVRG